MSDAVKKFNQAAMAYHRAKHVLDGCERDLRDAAKAFGDNEEVKKAVKMMKDSGLLITLTEDDAS